MKYVLFSTVFKDCCCHFHFAGSGFSSNENLKMADVIQISLVQVKNPAMKCDEIKFIVSQHTNPRNVLPYCVFDANVTEYFPTFIG